MLATEHITSFLEIITPISPVAPFTLRTLLYGVDEFEFSENKNILNETLKFIHETKRFE